MKLNSEQKYMLVILIVMFLLVFPFMVHHVGQTLEIQEGMGDTSSKTFGFKELVVFVGVWFMIVFLSWLALREYEQKGQ